MHVMMYMHKQEHPNYISFFISIYLQGWYVSRLAPRGFLFSTTFPAPAPDLASELPPAFLSIMQSAVQYSTWADERALNREFLRIK